MNTKVADAQKHSAAHVLAMAVCRLYPNVKIGVGPVTKEGYYYDFDLDQKIEIEDLPKIEAEMNNIIQSNLKFQQVYLQRDNALNLLLQRGQIYKAELIRTIPDQEISFYKTGEEFLDLCRGPHVSSTNQIGVVNLTKIDKSNWNDDPTRPSMIRIYGKVFKNLEDLIEYKKLQEDLKEKNFSNLSKKLHFGVIDKEHDLVLTERGTSIFKKIQGIFNKSFGIENFKELIFTKDFSNELELDSTFNLLINFENSSYKDFPFKYSFLSNLSSLSFAKSIKKLGILSFRFLNRDIDMAQSYGDQFESLTNAFKNLDIDFSADVYAQDFDETFAKQTSSLLQRKIISHNKVIKNTKDIYVFIKVSDQYEKEWVLATLKLHISRGKKGVLTSFDIYLSEIWKYLVERYEGKMPDYLNPIDVICLPVNKNYYNYAIEVANLLTTHGYNAVVNNRAKSFNRKIMEAENLRIPFKLVVGQKEQANSSVSLRDKGVDAGLMSIESLLEKLKETLRR